MTESIASVRDAIALGIILCVLVLGLSLRDVRAGLLAAATVPVTLASTFVVMKVMHQTLNLMSLGGMAVAIGLVIDDAIVVVEAIARHHEHGVPPEEAAARGDTNDLAPAVLGTTITTVIVFLPLAFVSGLVGDFFSALAGTLSAAVDSFAGHLAHRRAGSCCDVAASASGAGASHAPPRARTAYGAVASWGARRRWVRSAASGRRCARRFRSRESWCRPGSCQPWTRARSYSITSSRRARRSQRPIAWREPSNTFWSPRPKCSPTRAAREPSLGRPLRPRSTAATSW